MLLTDLNGPLSFQPRRPGSGKSLSRFRVSAFAILFFTSATISTSISSAQDVAEAARQEQARKQEQQKNKKHVYTDEDLKRQRILTPEDQAAVEAKKNACAQKNNCAPAAPGNSQDALDAKSRQPQPAVDTNSQQKETSLGEVARQYRKQKELEALKPKQSEPFHISIGTPALAAPVLPEHPALRTPAAPVFPPAAKPVSGSGAHTNVFRRDPFARTPARPRAPLDGTSEIRPAVRAPAQLLAPAAPRISSHSAAPPKLPAEPAQLAEPKKSLGEFRPARPIAPAKSLRANSLAVPANIFPAAKLSAPIGPPASRPAAPAPSDLRRAVAPVQPQSRKPVAPQAFIRPATKEFNSATPVAVPDAQPPKPAASFEFRDSKPAVPGKTIRAVAAPRLRSTLPSPLNLVVPSSARPASPAAEFGFNPAKPAAPKKAIQPIVAPRLVPALPSASFSPVAPSAVSPIAPTAVAPLTPAATVSKARKVRVVAGDSLWKLARQSLGRGRLWPQILAMNPGMGDPTRLRPGSEVLLPRIRAVAVAVTGSAVGVRTIQVRKGDTLWTLAKTKLSSGSAWRELAAANPSLADPNRIYVGQELTLPATVAPLH